MLLAIAVFALASSPPGVGWQSLGRVRPSEHDERAVVLRGDHALVSVTAISPEVVRVRFAPRAAFGRDHSYAVVNRALGDPHATVTLGDEESTLSTSALRVTIAQDPFRIRFTTRDGQLLDEDDPERGTASVGSTVRVWKVLRDDEHVFGFGEKNGRLDKRGRNLGGYSYTMWNSDTYAYDLDTDPIYVSVPFFMVLRKGRAHGIFLDNTFRSTFDIGHESPNRLSFGAEGGTLDYYFIDGPSPKEVIERYTALTGRTPLPPRWALGYHQCRYSYYPESKVRDVADNFRKRHIPADTLWLDIHYQDGYRPFTWDARRFPDPKKLMADLRAQGFRVVTIVDPHPKKEVGYAPYDTGLAGDHFVKRADGSVFEGPVWPSRAEKDPAPSVFPDFSRPATRAWWGRLYAPLLDAGVAGIWNDMNEPAVFDTPTGTMPLDNRHDNEGEPSDHREIHNVYGLQMARATYEGLQTLRPNERPFVLSRASFAGGQRYTALWPGDNQADWSHLRGSLATLMGLGLSGFPFVGSDIGGFASSPSAELYTRWLQASIFSPFMRTHANLDTAEREPWSFGERTEETARRVIELRYEMLPHVYNVMRQASVTGLPALRPLLLDYPGDEKTYDKGDEYLFGDDILAAPVVREGAARRSIYLPSDDWYDFWTGARKKGGETLDEPVTIDSIPLYVRGGAFLFRQPVVQHTGEMRGQPLRVDIYPAPQSKSTYYEDDGLTLDYRKGVFFERDFFQERQAQTVIVALGAARGSFRPAGRELVLRVKLDQVPSGVRLGAAAVPVCASARPSGTPPCWSWEREGWAAVRLRDGADAMRVEISAASSAAR